MNCRRSISAFGAVVAVVAVTSAITVGWSAAAEERQPVLRLGNRRDRCDTVFPEMSSPSCPPYLVPPLYLPSEPYPPAPGPEAKSSTPDQPRVETVPIKPAEPDSSATSTFQAPADPGELFSKGQLEPLNKLNTLLDVLQDQLLQAVPPLDFQDVPTSDAPGSRDQPTQHAPPEPPSAPINPETALPPPPTIPMPPEVIDPPAAALIQQSEPVSVAVPPAEPLATKPRETANRNPAAWISQTAVDAPVDRVALADNLFAAGETTTALSIYSEIDMETLSEVDRHWVNMQLAGCYRRLGNIEDASKYYRMLVTVENPAWMAEMSRWWLMVLDRRKSMARQSSDLETAIQQLKEQRHAESRR